MLDLLSHKHPQTCTNYLYDLYISIRCGFRIPHTWDRCQRASCFASTMTKWIHMAAWCVHRNKLLHHPFLTFQDARQVCDNCLWFRDRNMSTWLKIKSQSPFTPCTILPLDSLQYMGVVWNCIDVAEIPKRWQAPAWWLTCRRDCKTQTASFFQKLCSPRLSLLD